MKEQDWEEVFEDRQELPDAAAILEEESTPKTPGNRNRARVNALRRRLEERLDNQRIALEFDYEGLDQLSDKLQ